MGAAHGMNGLLGTIGVWQLLSYSQEPHAVFFLIKMYKVELILQQQM